MNTKDLRAPFLVAWMTVCALALLATGCDSASRSPLAIRADWEPYVGRHVGGSRHFGGSRRTMQGVWGRDYSGLDLFHIIDLRWSHHSQHQQVGLGSY